MPDVVISLLDINNKIKEYFKHFKSLEASFTIICLSIKLFVSGRKRPNPKDPEAVTKADRYSMFVLNENMLISYKI